MEGMWRRLVSCACILVLWQALYLLNVHVIAAVHGWENAYSEGLPPPYINIPSQFNLHLISFCTDTDAQAQVGTHSHRFSLAQNVKNNKHTNARAHPNLETHIRRNTQMCMNTHSPRLGWPKLKTAPSAPLNTATITSVKAAEHTSVCQQQGKDITEIEREIDR